MKYRLFAIITLSICLFVITACNNNVATNNESSEYSENVESIEHYFNELHTINKVYFKSTSLNDDSRVPGPSTFTITGFICISAEEVNTFLEQFDLAVTEVEFPNDVSPDVTGYDTFKWHTSYEFTRYLLKGNFVGSVYIDTENCVIYVDVQSA